MGIDGSYDTVLVLFQNSIEENDSKKDQSGYIQMLPESVKQSAKIRSLGHVLPCQLLIKAKKRGKIPETFTASGSFTDTFKFSSRKQFKIWSAARSNLFAMVENNPTPSFAATKSFAFTPIVPYPATEFDTIFTCMKNFHDVLQQHDLGVINVSTATKS